MITAANAAALRLSLHDNLCWFGTVPEPANSKEQPVMPTTEELDAMSMVVGSTAYNRLPSNDARREVMALCLAVKRNELLDLISLSLAPVDDLRV